MPPPPPPPEAVVDERFELATPFFREMCHASAASWGAFIDCAMAYMQHHYPGKVELDLATGDDPIDITTHRGGSYMVQQQTPRRQGRSNGR